MGKRIARCSALITEDLAEALTAQAHIAIDLHQGTAAIDWKRTLGCAKVWLSERSARPKVWRVRERL